MVQIFIFKKISDTYKYDYYHTTESETQGSMLRVQAAYAKAVKKGGVPESKLRAMADKGFAAEIATLKALKTLQKFQKLH